MNARPTNASRHEKVRVSVVVPAMNEAKNLPHVFARLPHGLHEVILVDGRSVDDTVEVARALRPDIRVVGQTRRGKGNALACGFAAATGDVVVMIDADGSTDPAEIPAFVQALLDGADFAKGTRFGAGGGSADITRLRRWGNKLLNGIVNLLYRTHYTDLCYGYNAFWRHCLDKIDLDCTGFEGETLMNIRVVKAGLKVQEIPSHEYLRIHGTSNLRAVRDGLRVLKVILKERSNRRALRRREQHSPTLDAVLDSTRGEVS
jgi:glycosyltransferase involved in cell wall biosynthesis